MKSMKATKFPLVSKLQLGNAAVETAAALIFPADF
jgi:hypothetical protein